MGLFDIFKKKAKLTEEEHKWNKMWELWSEGHAASPYAELMTYQSEVNNGGHLQYFNNVDNTSNLQKEMASLKSILPSPLRATLEKAFEAYSASEEKDDEEAEEIFEQCDDMFYKNEEDINRILEEYAAKIEL